ncbi:MAG TPA: S41 family peptidase [Gemmatimonadales bacterium]|nr:S41 family peptidase [Gemmatimonadales bacterium]
MRARWPSLLLVAVLSFFLGGWLLGRGIANDTQRGARLFDDVMARVSDAYVDSLPPAELYERAAKGLVRSLDDPYTALLQGADFRDLRENTSGNFSGIGIQIDVRDGWITVVAPLPETPAERAGLGTGDRVVEVDGASTEGWNGDQALRHLRGPAGTKVRVGVRHPGQTTTVTYELTRAEIHVRSVTPGVLLDGGVGYVALNPVADSSSDELEAEVARMVAAGAKSIVLDLRNNPGGLLTEGVKVSDLFLDQGQVVLSTRGRAPGTTQSWSDEAPQRWPDLPLVVLVNEGTASAAEIIAGALQDHDRAVLVGDSTYGKGLVQTVYDLGDSTALKITTSRWYTPSGRLIQKAHAIDSVLSDTARVARDTVVHHTDAGRRVLGNGGIVPDIHVADQTIGAGARKLAEALGSRFGDFRDVTTAYALETRQQGSLRTEAFTVTPAMRAAIRTRLAARGVRIDDATWANGSALVDLWLGADLSRYVFGREAELRRRRATDPQLQAALTLLRGATTPQALLRSLAPDSTVRR